MRVDSAWRKLGHGTPVFIFVPGATTRHDGIVRDGIVYNDPQDDYCVGFGAAIDVDGKRISLPGNAMVFDTRDERDYVANAAESKASGVRSRYYSEDARKAREDKLNARDIARENAAVQREIKKMKDAFDNA